MSSILKLEEINYSHWHFNKIFLDPKVGLSHCINYEKIVFVVYYGCSIILILTRRIQCALYCHRSLKSNCQVSVLSNWRMFALLYKVAICIPESSLRLIITVVFKLSIHSAVFCKSNFPVRLSTLWWSLTMPIVKRGSVFEAHRFWPNYRRQRKKIPSIGSFLLLNNSYLLFMTLTLSFN